MKEQQDNTSRITSDAENPFASAEVLSKTFGAPAAKFLTCSEAFSARKSSPWLLVPRWAIHAFWCRERHRRQRQSDAIQIGQSSKTAPEA